MYAAFEQFQIATCLIQEGNRVAASAHLRAALRAIDRSKKPDPYLRADIEKLLAHVQRVAKEAA